MDIIDIHPHIISENYDRYPTAPLFGQRSAWSQERPFPVESLITEMNQAGVAKAAVVHSSTTYGFDNTYVLDGCKQYPDRLVAVGSVDMLAPGAATEIESLSRKGLAGLRIFTGGSTKKIDPGNLDDSRSFSAWEAAEHLGLPVCIQTGQIGLPKVATLAKRFPRTNIILDHMAAPDLLDGPPYANASPLFALAQYPNVFLKLTPRTFGDVRKGNASPETFFPRLLEVFGSQRLAWGSNTPATPGGLSEIIAIAKAGVACLSNDDQAWIFSRTAFLLYPDLSKL